MNINQKTTIINLLQEKGFVFSNGSTVNNLDFYRKTNENDEIGVNTEGSDEAAFIIVDGKTNGKSFNHIVNSFEELKAVIQSIS